MTGPGEVRDRSAGELWRAARGPVLVGALLLLSALVLALLSSGGRSGLLDPRAADRPGSKALAQLLRDQGVEVRLAETTDAAVAAAAAGGKSTLLVAFPQRLVPEQLDRLRQTSADLVLVAPQAPVLSALGVDVVPAGGADSGERPPTCHLPTAQRAGAAEVGGVLYSVGTPGEGSAQLCYPVAGDAALVALETRARTVTVIGDPTPFTNDRLDESGNAALTLGLLGQHARLVWYLPSLSDVPPGAQRPLRELVPDGVLFGTVQLFVAAVVLALWRARRLGPVVPEPLPVIVRAAESVEGRARLYRRAHARDTAATTLRHATRRRLGASLGLPRAAAPESVVEAVARRTGRSASEVSDVLYGPAPSEDAGLVRLADALDQLDREVRRP